MAGTTKIEWCDATFNCWRGCTKISEGCKACYAETMSGRNPKTLGVWGPNGTRVVASEAKWREPLKWNKLAAGGRLPDGTPNPDGRRPRVFCASLADVFEDWAGPVTASNGNPLWWCHGSLSNSPIPSTGLTEGCRLATMDDVRQRLFDTIAETPHLDWLILTKRPAVMRDWLRGEFMGADGTGNAHAATWPWPNVWLGVSVEDQKAAKERIPVLLDVPAAVHFLSCEPLLGEVDVSDYLYVFKTHQKGQQWPHGPVNWVIVGAESGPGSRTMQIEWARSLVRQCKDAGRACFVKQLGGTYYEDRAGGDRLRIVLNDRKGGDIEEFPADLQVRQFPEVRDVGS
jgi:protein gp37